MRLLKYGAVLLFLMTLWGCGTGGGSKAGSVPAVAVIDPATNAHPVGMAVAAGGGLHVAAYFQTPASCEGCHGKATELGGGTSKISCSTVSRSGISCHAGKWPHGFGFDARAAHGPKAKAAASNIAGMASCKNCHGSGYRGVTGFSADCIGCHAQTKPTTGAPHANFWKVGTSRHSGSDVSNAAACAQCHRNTAAGAPSASTPAGCFNNTLCHFEGAHALPDPTTGYANPTLAYYLPGQHGSAAKSGIVTNCSSCHAVANSSPPDFSRQRTDNAQANPNMVAGCQTCHQAAGIAHPVMWLPNRGPGTIQSVNPVNNTLTKATSHGDPSVGFNCTECHGTTLTGGVAGSTAPSCWNAAGANVSGISCHFSSPVGTATLCTSCHAYPPNGAGATGPNRAYRHTSHSFTGMTCDVCHTNNGPGTVNHANGSTKNVDVIVASKFNENGTATYYDYFTGGVSQGMCANVSCHGNFSFGAATWRNGASIDLTATGCTTTCHNTTNVDPATTVGAATPTIPTPNYIGPFSGRNPFPALGNGPKNLHQGHLTAGGATCFSCHDQTKISSPAIHFGSIIQGRRILAPGFAAGTVGGTVGGILKVSSYSYAGGVSSCTSTCHVVRSWY